MALVLAYLGGYLWLVRRDLRFPQALILLPLGLAAIWIANVLRIVGLILIGDRVFPSLALGGFHSQAGWITFNVVALGVAVIAHRSRLFAKRRPDPTFAPANPTVAYLSPLLAAVAIQMLAEALASEPMVLYPLRVLVVAALLWLFWDRYDRIRFDRRLAGAFAAFVAGTFAFLL
jgi:exosortase/archaeosortase family protein